MKAMSSTSTDRMMRARSSRRWSDSAIRPSGPTGCSGLPLRSPARRLIKGTAASGGVAAVGPLGFSVQLPLPIGQVALLGLELQLGLGLQRVGSGLLVVVHQALGLGLEDPQGPAAAAGQLGELGGAEEQDEDGQDDQELGGAESSDGERGHEVLTWSVQCLTRLPRWSAVEAECPPRGS